MCQHTDPGMTLKHRDFDPLGSGRYNVTNKNIVSSKIPIVVRRKRGCHSGASPSLVGF